MVWDGQQQFVSPSSDFENCICTLSRWKSYFGVRCGIQMHAYISKTELSIYTDWDVFIAIVQTSQSVSWCNCNENETWFLSGYNFFYFFLNIKKLLFQFTSRHNYF